MQSLLIIGLVMLIASASRYARFDQTWINSRTPSSDHAILAAQRGTTTSRRQHGKDLQTHRIIGRACALAGRHADAIDHLGHASEVA